MAYMEYYKRQLQLNKLWKHPNKSYSLDSWKDNGPSEKNKDHQHISTHFTDWSSWNRNKPTKKVVLNHMINKKTGEIVHSEHPNWKKDLKEGKISKWILGNNKFFYDNSLKESKLTHWLAHKLTKPNKERIDLLSDDMAATEHLKHIRNTPEHDTLLKHATEAAGHYHLVALARYPNSKKSEWKNQKPHEENVEYHEKQARLAGEKFKTSLDNFHKKYVKPREDAKKASLTRFYHYDNLMPYLDRGKNYGHGGVAHEFLDRMYPVACHKNNIKFNSKYLKEELNEDYVNVAGYDATRNRLNKKHARKAKLVQKAQQVVESLMLQQKPFKAFKTTMALRSHPFSSLKRNKNIGTSLKGKLNTNNLHNRIQKAQQATDQKIQQIRTTAQQKMSNMSRGLH